MEPIILPRKSDQKPLVSVVSITYNHEPYIRDCLEGFLMQKTDFPVEVIIHDDASTDHTADIICEYYEKRPDLFRVIIERENRYSQKKPILNPLLEHTNGKYIALCEGDDYWIDPLKLQKQFDYLESHPDYSAYFHNRIIRNEKTKNETVSYNNKTKETLGIKDVIVYQNGIVLSTASFFFRKEIIDFYFEFKKGCPVGDYPLTVCLALKGKIKYDNTPMSVYRKEVQGSWSSRIKNSEKIRDFTRKMLLWLDNVKDIVNSEQEINEAKGYYKLTMYLMLEDYESIKNDEQIKLYINTCNWGRMMRYKLMINFPKVYNKLLGRIKKSFKE